MKNHGKIDFSKIECYRYHNMGHYKNQCPENTKKNKRERDQATIATNEAPPKKNKIENYEAKDLF